MGILRTDKVSGLETPTPVTGSVSFPGSSDNLSIGSAGDFNFLHNGATDWTVEFWAYTGTATRQFVWGTTGSSLQTGFYLQIMSASNAQSDATGVFALVGRASAGNYIGWGADNCLAVNTWHHIAAVFKSSDKTLALYVDGREVDNDAGTVSGTFAAANYSSSNSSYPFTVGKNIHGNSNYMNGYISNLRVVAGRRLYTSDFTVPVHALEVIGGTVLLCCNNSDTTGNAQDPAAGAEATGKIITITGLDIRASTFSPSLTRDFTGGTEFNGVTTFDTQGYFVPPSGTTEQRGRGRGLIRMADNAINYITISSLGNSQDFGDATAAAQNTSACASSTRGLFSQGYDHPSYYKTIDYVTIATTGNAQDFGDIATSASFIYGMGGCSSSTRGLFAGGFTAPSPNAAAGLKQINYVIIASLGNSRDFGDLTGNGVRYPAATSSPTRGLFAGGRDSADAPVYNQNDIHYVTIATLGNALDFGDLSYTPYSAMGTGSSTRGIFTGGYNSAGNAAYDNIEYVTIASTGNAQDFGNLTVGRGGSAASSNSTRATFAGGNSIPAATNHIDYITIASTGDALNFGDLMSTMSAGCGCSDSHGGIS